MNIIQKILAALSLLGIFNSCSIGMLLFYKDSKTETIFKSPKSNQGYFIIKATNLYNCGCTELYVDSYRDGKKDFRIFYNGRYASKTSYIPGTNKLDSVELVATTFNNYTTAFQPQDKIIFDRIDSIIVQKPKGLMYAPERAAFKGYISKK